MIKIRQCSSADIPYIYEICWKTAFRGSSIEEVFSDKFKTGHYFAAPYLHYNQEFCFTATDNATPKGYIVGTFNTVNYTKWLNDKWLPTIRGLCNLSNNDSRHPVEQFLNNCIKNDTVINQFSHEYPAHLHINLLPELRGRGIGRKLMDSFFNQCLEKGVDKVHLAVAKENRNAVAFYSKMGMNVISETETVYTMGLNLTQK